MEGYKGFYKTENNLVVRDNFSQLRSIDEIYFLDDETPIKYGGNTSYYDSGHGFHFADSISKTMPYFRTAITSGDYVVTKIETFGEVDKSLDEEGCYAARGYKINNILNHNDIIDFINNNIDPIESVRILGQYSSMMSDEEKTKTMNLYHSLIKEYSTDFEQRWIDIYCLYEGIMYLNSEFKSEYFNADNKKEYTKKLIREKEK